MTEEEQQVAIAEACGWGKPYQEGVPYRPMANAPDYLHDTDAMLAAEKTLEDPNPKAEQPKLNLYATELICVSVRAGNHYTFQANAAQRAEAFLKTIRRWRDE